MCREFLDHYNAKLMRRTRQNYFYIVMEPDRVYDKELDSFDFSIYRDIIALFFDEGFEVMELNSIMTKADDFFIPKFKHFYNTSITFDSAEGIALTKNYINAL